MINHAERTKNPIARLSQRISIHHVSVSAIERYQMPRKNGVKITTGKPDCCLDVPERFRCVRFQGESKVHISPNINIC